MYISLKNRIFGLDVIRALAILLVLCSHSTLLLFPNQKHILLTVIQFFGTVGVDLFFVLSGFLIGTIILKQVHKGQTKFKDFCYFWVRRWFRTLPNYFLILLINIALLFVLKGEVLKGIGVYFAFFQNFNTPHPDFFTEAWSLSIEEYAYIIGPRLNFHFNNDIHNMREWSQHIRKVVIYRIDSVYYGFLMAFLMYYYNATMMRFKGLLFGVG